LLFIIYFNIRSLQNIWTNQAYLVGFKNQPEIVAISETKLKEGAITCNIDLNGYNFVYTDNKTCASGVGL